MGRAILGHLLRLGLLRPVRLYDCMWLTKPNIMVTTAWSVAYEVYLLYKSGIYDVMKMLFGFLWLGICYVVFKRMFVRSTIACASSGFASPIRSKKHFSTFHLSTNDFLYWVTTVLTRGITMHFYLLRDDINQLWLRWARFVVNCPDPTSFIWVIEYPWYQRRCLHLGSASCRYNSSLLPSFILHLPYFFVSSL